MDRAHKEIYRYNSFFEKNQLVAKFVRREKYKKDWESFKNYKCITYGYYDYDIEKYWDSIWVPIITGKNYNIRNYFFHYTISYLGGIYAIVNTRTNRPYIGKAGIFLDRWKSHLSDLKRGKHSCWRLQADYNSGEQFMLVILSFFIFKEDESRFFMDNILYEEERSWLSKYKKVSYNTK
jgi:hypothetical protein